MRRIALGVGGLVLAASTYATAPHLANVLPTGAQRGTEIEMQFLGDRLQDTEEIICYEPGLQVVRLEAVTNKSVRAQVKLAPDCALGEYHLRLRTATGISELRTFLVGPFPAVPEVEPNNGFTNAQKVPLNTTISGVITNEDVDCFLVEVKAGQRISAEVEGMRLGRSAFDPRLALLDSSGAVLVEAADNWLALQDPFLSLVAPHDGTYFVQLREVTYGGSERCQYRLHIGSFPRPTSIFPLGGKAGDNLDFKFYSEATGEFTQRIELPGSDQEKLGFFAEKDGLPAPTPNWIRVSEFANIVESPPNQDRQHATTTEFKPPFALNGIIANKAEEDWYRFPATKGIPLEVTVYARRLRSPLDSIVEILDVSGKSLASDDDADGADSVVKFTPAESTNYFVRIRDTLWQGGREFGYRVEVVPTQPRLALKIPEVSRNDSQSRQYIAVPRGNRFATLISAKRSNFSGALDLEMSDLPPGLTMRADTMAANIDAMPLVFEAEPDAPIGGRLLDLTVTATNATQRVTGNFHQQVELVEGPNNTTYYGTRVDKIYVAVVKEAPFKLRIVDPVVPLVQGGSMQLGVVAERAPGFDEPIEVQMVWNPPGMSSQSEATIPKGATNVFYQLNAGGGAETRTWRVAILGHALVDGGQEYVSSQLAKLEVAPPYLSGKIETLWLNPGKQGKLTVNLSQAKPFEGKASIRLCGLPDKVTAPEREITKDDQEVIFDVSADAGCQPGSHKKLFCSVDVKEHGQIIPHNLALGGILRIVAPKKQEAKTPVRE